MAYGSIRVGGIGKTRTTVGCAISLGSDKTMVAYPTTSTTTTTSTTSTTTTTTTTTT